MPGSLGKAPPLSDDFDHPDILAAELLVHDGQLLRGRGPDVVECLGLGRSLRPASGKARNGSGEALFRSMQCDLVFHGCSIAPHPAIAIVRSAYAGTASRRRIIEIPRCARDGM